MDKFDQYSETAQEIMYWFEGGLRKITDWWPVTLKDPIHDVSRRFLNEIVEFEPIEEGGFEDL